MSEKTGLLQIRVKPAFKEAVKWAAAQDGERSVSSKVVLIVEEWLRKNPNPKTRYLERKELSDDNAA